MRFFLLPLILFLLLSVMQLIVDVVSIDFDAVFSATGLCVFVVATNYEDVIDAIYAHAVVDAVTTDVALL